MNGKLPITLTVNPRRLASKADKRPVGPPPTTTRSTWWLSSCSELGIGISVVLFVNSRRSNQRCREQRRKVKTPSKKSAGGGGDGG